ncbi:dihydrofolate reductase [Vibrio sinensis]|uniref:Dihydrofolate reductase n=1 Tax=Vibrio sinensis TaxID=2302434 RepID=A0A3A6R333_9VIBR|nr:dihydrofolate reductase family protein [Vibrio sinensis]RJX71024.1 dihydrofolate reductase [Vibrio sinensis]
MANVVFIATSLDGYIADKNGGLEWLNTVPNPTQDDMGFNAHMERIDALVMGRNTFEMVLSFGVDWPYSKPVYVLSNTLTSVPAGYEDKVSLIKGELDGVIATLNQQGYHNLYIDGGVTVQQFLEQDLIDEMIISTIPVLLGGGVSLFGSLPEYVNFTLKSSTILLDEIVQSHYLRRR